MAKRQNKEATDIGVLRLQHQRIDEFITAYERDLDRLCNEVKLILIRPAPDAGELAVALLGGLERLFKSLSMPSLIEPAYQAVNSAMLAFRDRCGQSVDAFAQRIHTLRSVFNEKQTFEQLGAVAIEIINILEHLLGPAKALRHELQGQIEAASVVAPAAPAETPRRMRRKQRDKLISQHAADHPHLADTELTEWAMNDPAIKALGEKVSIDVIRNAKKVGKIPKTKPSSTNKSGKK